MGGRGETVMGDVPKGRPLAIDATAKSDSLSSTRYYSGQTSSLSLVLCSLICTCQLFGETPKGASEIFRREFRSVATIIHGHSGLGGEKRFSRLDFSHPVRSWPYPANVLSAEPKPAVLRRRSDEGLLAAL